MSQARAGMMLAARLHGPEDLRVEQVPRPGEPPPGTAMIRVRSVGICGSDLHTYRQARIGDTTLQSPLVLGHEFAGTIDAVGAGSVDGFGQPLAPGALVAVEPAEACGRCECCLAGNPNLCTQIRFCGLWPDDGALCQWMHMPARNCFPLPSNLDAADGVMLEPLGVALHAVDLAKLRVARSVAILGAGPIGLCILQVARLAGAGPIFVSDKFPWRVDLARRLGATKAMCHEEQDVVRAVREATGGRGVDVAFEAGWSGEAVEEAAEMLAPGGRLVVVGIADDDRLSLRHSTARRKGLTISMVRRMKHTYPRAIRLAAQGLVDLRSLVSHHFPLQHAAEAFAVNAAYADGAVKVVVDL
jgi:L-iditol 2-dehydrogenase